MAACSRHDAAQVSVCITASVCLNVAVYWRMSRLPLRARPCGELVRVGRGKVASVPDLAKRARRSSTGPQPAVEVIVEQHLRARPHRFDVTAPGLSASDDVEDEGLAFGRLGADVDRAVESLNRLSGPAPGPRRAARARAGPPRPRRPLGQATIPAVGLDRVLLAGPAGTQPPRRDTDGLRVEPGDVAAGSAPDSRRAGARGSSASRSPPWAVIIAPHVHRPPVGQDGAGVGGDDPAISSISRASATVTSTTSSGPPPASTSTDSLTSSALPAARPSGWSMSVSSAAVRMPWRRRCSTIVSASVRHRRASA